MISRPTWRARQSDSTPREALSSRHEHSGSRTPALKGPIHEGTRFGKLFRMGIGEVQSGWNTLTSNANVMQSADNHMTSQLVPEKGSRREEATSAGSCQV